MKRFLSSAPLWQNEGLLLLRIVFAFLLAYHGYEIFNPELMKGYTEWDIFKSNAWLPYLGKGVELVAGIFLFFGFLTRLCCLVCIPTFAYITFVVGEGRFWYEEQHPFMFIMMALVFIFTGPGAFSIDSLLFKKR
jgi:putative oxidoreductase